MKQEISRLRRNLTLWYMLVFGSILILFGTVTYYFIAHQWVRHLDGTLVTTIDALALAVNHREREPAAQLDSLAAVSRRLEIPGRMLYVLDDQARPIVPSDVPDWIMDAARIVARDGGEVWSRYEDHDENDAEDDRTWRLYGRRLEATRSSPAYIAVIAADAVELENQYSAFITVLVIGALLALALAGVGGYVLAGRAALPAKTAFDGLRRFTADASHQLRTPVAVIRSRAEVALDGSKESAELEAALTEIAAESARLGDVLDKLLLLSRVDAGQFELRRQRVFLDDAMFDSLPVALALARPKEIEVDVQADGDCSVAGEPTLLRQLIAILLDNAIKFGPHGSRVSIEVRDGGPDVLLNVVDAGPGIPADLRHKIFEPFYKQHPGGARSDGVGLGLSIAQRIVAAHRGELSISTPGGGGTKVAVRLPRST